MASTEHSLTVVIKTHAISIEIIMSVTKNEGLKDTAEVIRVVNQNNNYNRRCVSGMRKSVMIAECQHHTMLKEIIGILVFSTYLVQLDHSGSQPFNNYDCDVKHVQCTI